MRKYLDNLEAYICAVLFLSMTAVGFANVVVRYLTSYSFAATQELLLSGFLLLTIFGAALAALALACAPLLADAPLATATAAEAAAAVSRGA